MTQLSPIFDRWALDEELAREPKDEERTEEEDE